MNFAMASRTASELGLNSARLASVNFSGFYKDDSNSRNGFAAAQRPSRNPNRTERRRAELGKESGQEVGS